jgi:hypothetical protein
MARAIFAFLLALLLGSTVQAEHAGTDDTPRLTFHVDFIQFDSGFLKKIGCDRPRPDGFLVLNEVEAYVVDQFIKGNNKDKNVYACSKDWYPDGKPITISNRVFDDATKRMIVRNGAWLHVQPFTFELTPKTVGSDAVRLTLTYLLNHRKRTRGPSTVPAGRTVLVLLDCSKNDVRLAALITPRIIGR